jgi:hypothetical protein
MPYQSAAERRRQRAAETAEAWGQPTLMDQFGRNERTGIGGRAHVADSVVRPTLAPPPPSHAYRYDSPTQPRPVSDFPGGGGHSPAVYDANIFGDNASTPAKSNAQQYHPVGYPPATRLPALGAGGHASPGKHHASRYEPHPLEYDGGVPLPYELAAQHFGGTFGDGASRPIPPLPERHMAPYEPEHGPSRGQVSSRALEEYYNRTRGPILHDDDRAAIEGFFATDDFAEQFNARANAVRAAAAAAASEAGHGPSQAGAYVVSPGRHGALPALAARPEPPTRDVGEPVYPLCHRCHQAIVEAVRRAPPPRGPPGGGRVGGARSGQPKRQPPRQVPAMKPTTGRSALGR